MSKGGAGKVYFVLYLAVILELLIIFIERDEAEEGLRRQQRRALEIVQTILAQLSTGAGTTGITASPKDNITLSQKELENVRLYDVTVSVGDTNSGGANNQSEVAQLDYVVSHMSNPSIEEKDLPIDSADLSENPIYHARLGMGPSAPSSYTQPKVIAGSSPPTADAEKHFALNQEKTDSAVARGRRVKIFSVNFKPNAGPGWYRLRFESLTNKILGVTRDQPADGDTVRIGNIKLTVKQLREVRKVLRNSGGTDKASTAKVQGYIDSLLAKNAYLNLPENKGYTSFNVRVVRPDIPPPSAPSFAWQGIPVGDTIYWYAGLGKPLKVGAVASPPEGAKSFGTGSPTQRTPGQYDVSFKVDAATPEGGFVPVAGSAQNARGERATDEFYIVAYAPTLVGGRADRPAIDQWRGRTATVGGFYNPTTQWQATKIPASHYQTRVWINDNVVLDRAGTDFNKTLSAAEREKLQVPDGARIKTIVYWRPSGTADESEWVPLLSTDPSVPAPYSVGGVALRYPSPESPDLLGEYQWTIAAKELTGAGSLTFPSGEFNAQLTMGRQILPATVTFTGCDGCDEIRATADVTGTGPYQVTISAPKASLNALHKKKELTGKRVTVKMQARASRGDATELATDIVIIVK